MKHQANSSSPQRTIRLVCVMFYLDFLFVFSNYLDTNFIDMFVIVKYTRCPILHHL
jgi:hypothetical protein